MKEIFVEETPPISGVLPTFCFPHFLCMFKLQFAFQSCCLGGRSHVFILNPGWRQIRKETPPLGDGLLRKGMGYCNSLGRHSPLKNKVLKAHSPVSGAIRRKWNLQKTCIMQGNGVTGDMDCGMLASPLSLFGFLVINCSLRSCRCVLPC